MTGEVLNCYCMRRFLYPVACLFCFFSIFVSPSYAQLRTDSNTISTQVGNPSDTGINSTNPTSILDWDAKINSALELGYVYGTPYYQRMIQTISNGQYTAVKREGLAENTAPSGLYWCTNSIIDSYNLSGKDGLGDSEQGVVSMVAFWNSHDGYTYHDYLNGSHQSVLQAVKPSFAIFFESSPGVHTGYEHVAMVKSIQVDSSGNGEIQTYDSNSTVKISHYPVAGWSIKNTPYTVVGFGG